MTDTNQIINTMVAGAVTIKMADTLFNQKTKKGKKTKTKKGMIL